MRSLLCVFLVSVLLVVVTGSYHHHLLRRAFKKIAASALISAQVAYADAIPSVGTKAPEFVLPSNAGKSLSLNDFKGKRTVLYFYPVISINIYLENLISSYNYIYLISNHRVISHKVAH